MTTIKIEHLTKIFHDSNQDILALDDVNLTINQGDYVVIVGESGSGKSTLINILGGILKPDQGKVFFNGTDTSQFDEQSWNYYRRNHIGFIFQHYYLIDYLNAYDNVEMAISEENYSFTRTSKLLKLVRMDKYVDHLPSQLSGGQQQRVCIARSLANNPQVILCDEPTGALDLASTEQIMELIAQINKAGITVILITHNHKYLKNGNRLWLIENGKVIEK